MPDKIVFYQKKQEEASMKMIHETHEKHKKNLCNLCNLWFPLFYCLMSRLWGVTMELKSFKPENWIEQLYKKLIHIKKKKIKELDKINDIMYGDPLELAKYYVEPDCQEINPADRHEEDFLVSREPIHKKIKEFFKAKKLDQPGNNQMFILSDAGMGKTSLLECLSCVI